MNTNNIIPFHGAAAFLAALHETPSPLHHVRRTMRSRRVHRAYLSALATAHKHETDPFPWEAACLNLPDVWGSPANDA